MRKNAHRLNRAYLWVVLLGFVGFSGYSIARYHWREREINVQALVAYATVHSNAIKQYVSEGNEFPETLSDMALSPTLKKQGFRVVSGHRGTKQLASYGVVMTYTRPVKGSDDNAVVLKLEKDGLGVVVRKDFTIEEEDRS